MRKRKKTKKLKRTVFLTSLIRLSRKHVFSRPKEARALWAERASRFSILVASASEFFDFFVDFFFPLLLPSFFFFFSSPTLLSLDFCKLNKNLPSSSLVPCFSFLHFSSLALLSSQFIKHPAVIKQIGELIINLIVCILLFLHQLLAHPISIFPAHGDQVDEGLDFGFGI